MFATFRVAKLKSQAQIEGAGAHCCRTKDTPNADFSRQPLNLVLGGAPDQAIFARLEALRKEGVKWRTDAVRAVEIVAGASPDFWSRDGKPHPGQPEGWDMAKVEAFQQRLLEWAGTEFGQENVVSVTRHMDESSPHWHVFVVPVDRSPSPDRQSKEQAPPTRPVKRPRKAWGARLNAKRWLGGPKLLSALQTRFAANFAPLGLERGREGGRADYQSVQQFYSLVNAAAPQLAQVRAAKDAQAMLEKIIEETLGSQTRMKELARFAIQERIRQMQKEGLFSLATAQEGTRLKRALEQLAEDVGKGTTFLPAPERSR